jgi:hypothetical protein
MVFFEYSPMILCLQHAPAIDRPEISSRDIIAVLEQIINNGGCSYLEVVYKHIEFPEIFVVCQYAIATMTPEMLKAASTSMLTPQEVDEPNIRIFLNG